MKRRAFLLGSSALLAGCSPPVLLSTFPGPAPGEVEEVLVATSRAPSPDPGLMFEGERSDTLHYYQLDISVPPDRTPGRLRYPGTNPDPQREFMALDQREIPDERGFTTAINQVRSAVPADERTILVFVHGYNMTYPEAVFRTAQLRADLGIDGPTVLYSWPSAGRIGLYAYDRDSALFGREGLVDLLTTLSRIGKVVILGHSMGTSISMEAIRTLHLSRRNDVLNQLEGILLAEPDIDVDVFRRQIEDLDTTRLPIIVTASDRDRALLVSSLITGGHPRVGNAENIDALRDLGVYVVDISGIEDQAEDAVLGHNTFATSPTLLALLGSGSLVDALQQGDPDGVVLLRGVANASFAIAYLPTLILG